jgi:pyruvate oxidase
LRTRAKEQAAYGYPVFGISFPNPDFAEFARTCGGEGYRCKTPEQLDEALEKAFASDKPALIDILVDPEKMAPLTKGAE